VKRIILFFSDTIVCYLFALMYAIPFLNVALLREHMGDSIRLKKEMKKIRCKK